MKRVEIVTPKGEVLCELCREGDWLRAPYPYDWLIASETITKVLGLNIRELSESVEFYGAVTQCGPNGMLSATERLTPFIGRKVRVRVECIE